MLQKAAQEFVHPKRHRFSLMGLTVAESEGHVLSRAPNDCLVTERGAMHVTTEILQYDIGIMHRAPCRYDPPLAPGDMWKRNIGQRPTRQGEKPTSEALR